MTMKLVPDFGIYTGPVCKLKAKIPKNPILGNATSRHADFTKFQD